MNMLSILVSRVGWQGHSILFSKVIQLLLTGKFGRQESNVIIQYWCSGSRGAGKFVRSPSDSSQQRSSSRSAGSCLRLLLRFNAFIIVGEAFRI